MRTMTELESLEALDKLLSIVRALKDAHLVVESNFYYNKKEDKWYFCNKEVSKDLYKRLKEVLL